MTYLINTKSVLPESTGPYNDNSTREEGLPCLRIKTQSLSIPVNPVLPEKGKVLGTRWSCAALTFAPLLENHKQEKASYLRTKGFPEEISTALASSK